jgi:thiamine pyrophosphokinase
VDSSVLGVLAGRDLNFEKFERIARSASIVIAADGGAQTVLDLGREPDIVVGDLDSLDSCIQARLPDVRHDPDQMTSDADKLLSLADQLGYQHITLLGIEGDLPDHVLSTLHSVLRAKIEVTLLFRRGSGWVLTGESTRHWPSYPGQRVSLLPLSECREVSLVGVVWPLESATLSAESSGSISNQSLAAEIGVKIGSGSAFLFLEDPPQGEIAKF